MEFKEEATLQRALTLLSQKTGIEPRRLQEMAKSGEIASLITSPAGQKLLSDPEKLRRLVQDPRTAAFLKNRLKGTKGNG